MRPSHATVLALAVATTLTVAPASAQVPFQEVDPTSYETLSQALDQIVPVSAQE
jgi:hypothetical protein